MSQHFDAWVTWTGNILVMNHTIASMGAFPRGRGGRSFSQCRKGVQHKATPLAASLIAHRTSDTEKNNNCKSCGGNVSQDCSYRTTNEELRLIPLYKVGFVWRR